MYQKMVGSGLLILTGVGIASYLRYRKEEVTRKEEEHEKEEKVEEKEIHETVEVEEKKEDEETTEIFREAFMREGLGFSVSKWEADVDVIDNREDGLLLLVPPKEDKELFQMISGLVSNLNDLYNVGLKNKREEDRIPLKIRWVKIRRVEDLDQVSKKIGVDLSVSDDVPVFIVHNKNRKKPVVVTLMNIFDDEEAFYSQFRPIRMISSSNAGKFTKILSDIEEDEIILIQYCASDSPSFEDIRSNFYENSLSKSFSRLRSVDTILMTDLSWLGEAGNSLEIKSGDYFVVQKATNTLISESSVVPLEGSKYAVYKVCSGLGLSAMDILGRVSEGYYAQNVGVHLELPVSKKRYTLEFKYDANLMSRTQVEGCVEMMRELRRMFDEEIGQKVNVAIVPHSFDPTQGKAIDVVVTDNLIIEKRVKYLYKVKSQEEAAQLAKEVPEVARNDLFEYHYPPDLSFDTQSVKGFLLLTMEGGVSDQLVSQVPPKYSRYSRKLTGSIFTDSIRGSPYASAVFLYSSSCGSCKKFSPMYEKLAKENIEKGLDIFGTGKGMMYYRMNKDHNDAPRTRVFDSTPVFMVYRSDFRSRPFVYRGRQM